MLVKRWSHSAKRYPAARTARGARRVSGPRAGREATAQRSAATLGAVTWYDHHLRPAVQLPRRRARARARAHAVRRARLRPRLNGLQRRRGRRQRGGPAHCGREAERVPLAHLPRRAGATAQRSVQPAGAGATGPPRDRRGGCLDEWFRERCVAEQQACTPPVERLQPAAAARARVRSVGEEGRGVSG